MDSAKKNCEESEMAVESIPGEGPCMVDTKEIDPDHEEIENDLEFDSEFSQEHVNSSLSDLGVDGGGGVKRKHEDLMHIEGSEAKSAHIEEQGSEGYNAVQDLEDSSNSLESSGLTQEQVISSISQTCQVDPLSISQALSSITGQISHEPTLLPNSSLVESREDGVNQAWFTTKEDKDSLQGKGVKWRQGMWSKEENDILKENIINYCKDNNIADPNIIIFDMSKDDRKDFYRTIAKGIKRPLFAIYRRVLRMYDRRNYIGKYSPEEVKQLKSLKEKYGNDWATIGVAMGRSASSVKDRYRLLKENCQAGKWTAEEEERLSNAVHELSGTQAGDVVTTGISWALVAEKVETRSEKQCRSKWLNYLNWKEKGGKEWTKQDEIKLINRIYELDVENENLIDWKTLMTNWTSVRSPQWLRSKWWAMKKHIPANDMSFRDIVGYLHLHYVDTLQSKIERQESRYKNRLPQGYGSVLRNLERSNAHNANIPHTITVNSDGSIVTKDDNSTHAMTNPGRYEVLQLNNVSSPDGVFNTQANQLQPSYIIHSMQPSSITAQTYIIQQPTIEVVRHHDTSQVDTGAVHGEQVQISPQGVVMTAVLHPHHSVRCLPEVNPELAQAIVQTDISGPVEATHHLIQHEVPVSMNQPNDQQQLQTQITNQVNITSHPTGTLIDSANSHESNSEEINHGAVLVGIADNSLTTQNTEDISTNTTDRPINTTQYQQGPAAIAQSLDGTELCATAVSGQQLPEGRILQVSNLSSLIATYSTAAFSTSTSTSSPQVSHHALQKSNTDTQSIGSSTAHSFQISDVSQTTANNFRRSHSNSTELVHHSLQSATTLSHHTIHGVGNDELDSRQVSHGLTSSNPNLSASDLVPQADLPEQFLQSQADDAVELTLPSSSSNDIVMSSDVSACVTSIHPDFSHAGQVVTMATLSTSDSLMMMGQDGEHCVIVEEECHG
ncbi:cyclin-D-binding Myb-like transcription factor 1 [Actinia tenebrosa]|uniref:Cyclin-D-binding Myb-like transcription factor 1 n=1 Tax=Actinia tenebrosa TaxID=6105 RepID=A0A6P8IV52_ACTTE|nr:cyclin-D-binding Myb-like transcription factor 1 [Actinia tenebrosa]